MEIHPVLSLIQQECSYFHIDETGLVAHTIMRIDRRARKFVMVGISASDYETNHFAVRIDVYTRYPLQTVRVRKYLELLQQSLREFDISFEVLPPCGFGVRMEFHPEDFEPQFDVAEQAAHVYMVCLDLIYMLVTAVRLACLSYRMKGRGGTKQYQRLLPTQLALLTVHGCFHTVSFH